MRRRAGMADRIALNWRSMGISNLIPVTLGALRSCLEGSSTMQNMMGISTISDFAICAALTPTAKTTEASESRIVRASRCPRAISPRMSYTVMVWEDCIAALKPATAWLYAGRSADLRIASSAAMDCAGYTNDRRDARPARAPTAMRAAVAVMAALIVLAGMACARAK